MFIKSASKEDADLEEKQVRKMKPFRRKPDGSPGANAHVWWGGFSLPAHDRAPFSPNACTCSPMGPSFSLFP